jgi:hypothetical protein
MYVSHPRLNRLREYHRLSTWEKKVLIDWITANVDEMMLWSYTSVGITDLFEKSSFGFAISHSQMQQALVHAGYEPLDESADVWLFATGDSSQ